jgi:RNA polymerase sigma factor (sigma-70 family)
MANQDDDFSRLVHRAIKGDNAARDTIVEQHGETIRRAVRRVLSHRMRSVFDSLDFVQSVWYAVFQKADDLGRFQTADEFAAFVTAIAKNKVRAAARRRKHIHDERLDDDNNQHHNLPSRRNLAASSVPLPIETVIASESLNELLSIAPPVVRKVIWMRLQGFTHDEIAHAVNVSRGFVYRSLKKLSRDRQELS